MNYSEWHQIAQQAAIADIEQAIELSASRFSSSWHLICSDGQHYWVRSCLARHQALIDGERANIQALQDAGLKTATGLVQGKTAKTAWLISHWQALSPTRPQPQQVMAACSALQQHTSPRQAYGWTHTNDVNGLLQLNEWLTDWGSFYRSQRLLPQLRKAKENGLAQRYIEALEQSLAEPFEACFAGYQPPPTLLHGNLYQAPAQLTLDGDVFFYHPACYYGDAEVDGAAILLSEQRQALLQGDTLPETLTLSAQARKRLPWYQLYFALVEFNLMTQQDSRLIATLLQHIQSNH